jgi:DNA-binding NtrC family response regulator
VREVISDRGNDFTAAILGIEAGDASLGELVKWLRSIDPGFPIVLTTGPMTTEETERMRSDEALAVLEKPFRGDQLVQAVRSVLKSRSAS